MVRNDVRALLLVVFCAFALCALITKSHVTSWNDASRFATIDSLANRGTFAIEGSSFSKQTSDTYRYGGHTYSDKPPALALLAAGIARTIKGAGVTPVSRRSLWLYLITLLTIGAWFALGCGYAFAFARALGYSPPLAALSAALTGIATLNLPYATVFSNHVPCGAAMLAGLYHLFRLRNAGVHAAVAGVFFGLACMFDEAAVIVVIIAAVMLYRTPLSRSALFACAFVPFVALQAAYNWHFSGAPIPPGMNDRFWNAATGASSFDVRSLHEYFSNLAYVTIGNKGLFIYTPLSIVCVFGLAKLWQTQRARALSFSVLAASLLLLAFIVLFTRDWFAANYGERRFADIFFILCIGLAPALAALRGHAASYAALAAALFSIVMAALGTVNPFAGQGDVPGYAAAAAQFAQLARRSPLQAGLDVAALVIVIALVIRFWPRRADTRQASPPPHAAR